MEKDVRWLNVSVDNFLGIQCLETLNNMLKENNSFNLNYKSFLPHSIFYHILWTDISLSHHHHNIQEIDTNNVVYEQHHIGEQYVDCLPIEGLIFLF